MFAGIYTQSETTAARRRVPFHLVDATDGMTPETGEAGGQPEISKNGGAWASTTATLTAIGNGRYYVELTATELNTLGRVDLRYKSANTAEAIASAQVGALDIFSAAAAGPSAAAIADAVWDEATSGHTTGGTFGEQCKTDVDAIKAKTDNLPAAPAATGDIPTVAEIWDHTIEGSYSAEEVVRLIAAVLAGKTSGFGTGTVYFRDLGDSKNRIEAAVDGIGNRSSVTTDVS